MNILGFIDEPRLMGESFQGGTHNAMRTVLAATWGLPLDDDQQLIFNHLAGGREPPTERVRELWVIAGRRSEKTKTAAAIAVYMATVGAIHDGLSSKLSAGERAVVAIVAVDRNQAKLALQYVAGMVEESPILNGMIERRDTESILFTNGVCIEVSTNSFRAVRGRTLLACIFDEVAFFRADSSVNPDVEVYRAAQPGLATLNGLLIGISSPYSKKGLLYSKYRKHYGQNDDVLVVKGGTLDFNPTINYQVIKEALQDDPEAAKSEWLGEFRSDLEAFVSREIVESLARPSPLELPYDSKHHYYGFVDPAGGGQDDFTLSIGHIEGDLVVIDLVRGQKGTPAAIVAEYALTLKGYRIHTVSGDRYAGSWPADEFKKHGINFKHADKSKSDLYVDVLPLINSEKLEIPPFDKLINQFANLERRTGRSGKDTIDHPSGGHDDLANAVAGCSALCKKPKPITNIKFSFAT